MQNMQNMKNTQNETSEMIDCYSRGSSGVQKFKIHAAFLKDLQCVCKKMYGSRTFEQDRDYIILNEGLGGTMWNFHEGPRNEDGWRTITYLHTLYCLRPAYFQPQADFYEDVQIKVVSRSLFL